MSELQTIARPYAKAVFNCAETLDEKKNWQSFLKIAAQLAQHEDVLKNLSIAEFFSTFEQWLADLLVEKRQLPLSQEERNFICLLRNNYRLKVLPEIFEAFTELFNIESGHCPVTVFTAKTLTNEQTEQLNNSLRNKIGKDIILEIIEQPDLLAGVRIEYNGLVIDQSTKGRIEQFARKLDDLRN